MKNILFILLLSFTSIIYSQTPRAGGINNSQATILNIVHDNFVGIQPSVSNAFAVYNFSTSFDYNLGLKNTDNVLEGITNKYFSNTLARNAFSAGAGLSYTTGVYSLDTATQGILATVANKVSNTTTVNSQPLTANITLNKNDIGLSNVDNTSDINKPISTLTQAALNTKLSTEVDGSITNEIQALSIVGNTLSLSNGGGSVSIPSSSYTSGTGISIASNTITNTAPDQTVSLTGGNRIAITGSYPNFTISFVEPSVNIITTKTLNSNYTISTKQAIASYSLTCTVTNPLLTGISTADVYLEYSTNGGSTWQLPSRNGNSSSVAVAVAIAITNGQTVTLFGVIPPNALVRLRTVTTGTASVSFVTGTEIY